MNPWMHYLIWPLVKFLAAFIIVQVIVAAMNWIERRLLGFVQARLGPNRVGPKGLLQIIADPGRGSWFAARGPRYCVATASHEPRTTNHDHRSTSPRTISIVPINATRSETRCPLAMAGRACRFTNEGGRTRQRYAV